MVGILKRSFLIVIFASISYAGTRDPNIDDSKYVEYGKTFTSVGKVCGMYEDGSRFCGSAVAIDDHHILTAAHVVKNSNSCSFYINDQEYCLSSMVIHKDFEKDNYGVADLAIGYSEEPFNLKSYPDLYKDTDEIGKQCSISGYGFYGTFETGAKFHDNKKRAGLNIVDYIDEDMLVCSASHRSEKNITSMEFLIASGDSGGGLFIDQKLAGINSCVMAIDRSPNSSYNEESGHTRISKFIDWITENRTSKNDK